MISILLLSLNFCEIFNNFFMAINRAIVATVERSTTEPYVYEYANMTV